MVTHVSRLTLGLCATLAVVVSLVLPAQAAGTDRADVERAFRTWIEGPAWRAASARGISRATFDEAMSSARLEWSVPDLRPPGAPAVVEDWRQSEFGKPARYFDEGNLNILVANGRRHLTRWSSTLDAVEKRYGVPGEILLAIWARESGFGSAKIPHDAISILATQAFMGRRSDMFIGELLAALEMIDRGHVSRRAMRSSWAGALGQPQFLPSKYLLYAADGDGDGFSDIWESVPDTLASIANFLHKNGWQTGRDWGFEAAVPGTVSCAMEGPDRGMAINHWIGLGVTRVSGRPFPDHERPRPGFLMMPAGRYGPAFIATENFYVLKRYNESDLYALFIGHLADRLRANRPFVASWRKLDSFSRGDVQAMQQGLEALSYDVGGADGLVGFKTRRSIGDYQARNGITPTCFPDAELIGRLR